MTQIIKNPKQTTERKDIHLHVPTEIYTALNALVADMNTTRTEYIAALIVADLRRLKRL